MIYFYDTCSLLNHSKEIFEAKQKFIISDISIKELENIKTSDNKDAEIRFMRFDIIFSVVIEILLAVITFLILSVGGYFVYLTINGQTLNIFSLSINVNLTEKQFLDKYLYKVEREQGISCVG